MDELQQTLQAQCERASIVAVIEQRDGDALVRAVAGAAAPLRAMQTCCDAIDALALANLGDLPWAIDALTSLVTDVRDRGQVPSLCRALLSLAHVLSYANRFDEALAALRELIPAARDAGELLLAARGEVAMIHPLSRRGLWNDAIVHANAGRAELARLAERDPALAMLVAKADANLGVLHKSRHDPARAIAHFDLAIAAFAAHPAARAQLESNRGEALLELGRFDEAEAAFRRSLDGLTALGLDRAAAIVEGNLADLLGRLGRLADATETFERARRRHESAGAMGDVARLRAEQAELFAAAGLLVEARHELTDAIEGLEAAGLVAERGRACRAMARVLLRLGEPRAAQRVVERHRGPCIAVETGLDGPAREIERGRWQTVHGEIARAMGRMEEARTSLLDAASLLAPRRIERCVALAQLADVCGDLGRRGESQGAVNEATDIAESLGLAPLLAECLRIRAHVADRSVETSRASAIDDLRRAVDLTERTRGSLQADRLRSAFAAHASAVHEAHATALLASMPLHPSDLFSAIEAGRHRSLLDRLSADPSVAWFREEAEDQFDAEHTRLQTVMNGHLSRAQEVADSDALSTWRDELQQTDDQLRVLDARRNSAGTAHRHAADAVSLDDVRDRLDAHTALVQWCVTRGSAAALVVTRSGAEVFQMPLAASALNDAIEACRFQMARRINCDSRSPFVSRLRSDAIVALRRLHDMLVAPMTPRLMGMSSVHHVPAGALIGVPFHALHDGEAFAIERHEVTVTPSASAMLRLADRQNANGPRVIIGVGDERAPGIDGEVDALAQLWPDATVLRGSAATLAAVRDAVRGASVIHVAAHGRFPPKSPMSAGLRLADGWWTVRAIERCSMEGARVMVAACESGRMGRLGGDESEGLVRAFLCAGVSELVVSEWAAYDQTTQRLVAAAAARMGTVTGSGPGMAASLMLAMRDDLAAGEHPALWAPFTIYGAPKSAARLRTH